MFNFANIGSYIMGILLALPAILFGLSIHECAHAWMANKLGDPTAKNMGRLSLDPLKHIDPIGFLALIIVRFGWAKPVIVNPRNFKKPRRDDTLTSLAGPVSNLICAFLFTGIYFIIIFGIGWYNEIVESILLNFIFINSALFVFNLIPIPPLDGYHLLKNALLGKVNVRFFWSFEKYGQFLLIAIILLSYNFGILAAAVNFIIGNLFNLFGWIFGIV
ncbi:MAG: site-2 protease family protein [Christensenellales bacterium]